MNKDRAWELHGEWGDSPANYSDTSCVFCHYFTSYGAEFEDNYEPADVGRCNLARSGADNVGAEDTCRYFDLSAFYGEELDNVQS
jgi:hypothetical protein